MLSFTPERFAEFIEKLPILVACFDSERRYIALNEKCVQVNGVTRENTLGKSVDEVLPDLVDTLTPVFDLVYLEGKSVENKIIEGKTPASELTRFWLANYQPLRLANNKLGLLVTAEEITQQVFANKSAQSNKQLLTDVLNSLFTFVGLLDPNGVLVDANKAPLEAAGLSLNDVQGKFFWDCYWWSYSPAVQDRVKQAINEVKAGKGIRFDVDVRVLQGFITIDFMMEALKDDSGNIEHIIASAIDISERKQTEKQLKQSQSRFETVINRTVDGLVAFDNTGIIEFTNKRFEELTAHSVVLGKSNIFDFINDKTVLSRLEQLTTSVNSEGIHEAVAKASKDIPNDVCMLQPAQTPVEVALSPLLDGTQVLYLATVSDVSALYQANQALETALKEKTVLLNEVHHRVKNNLQVMSSLLNLQANSSGSNTQVKEALIDSQRRLKAMALIHELLYERENFTKANVNIFTHKLLHLLQESMLDNQDVNIVKELGSEPVLLSLSQLVPFGFLITELVTNAFKHAFVGATTDKPELRVKIEKQGDNLLVTVKDNGVGLQGKQAVKQSLGSELISIFSKQHNASLKTESGQGVKHTIHFAYSSH